MKTKKQINNSKKEEETLSFRTNGFIIEFIKGDKYFLYYLMRKSASFFIDILLYISLMLILGLAFNVSLINSFLITYGFFILYIALCILIFKNRTLGMVFAGLQIGSYDGRFLLKRKRVSRILWTSTYAIPFLGFVIIITTFFSCIINRGLTPIDLFSKTQVFNKIFLNKTRKIFSLIEKEREEKRWQV